MRFSLYETAVYWAPQAADGFGRPQLASPVELDCRWEESTENTIDVHGNIVLSSGTVYLKDIVSIGGLLMRGTLDETGDSGFPANPKQDGRAKEIIRVDDIPDLHARQRMVVAKLK